MRALINGILHAVTQLRRVQVAGKGRLRAFGSPRRVQERIEDISGGAVVVEASAVDSRPTTQIVVRSVVDKTLGKTLAL